MADPLEMSLDEYIKKKKIRVRDPSRMGWKQQASPRSYGSRGDAGWGKRQMRRQWRYDEEEEGEDEEEGYDEDEVEDTRWQDRRYKRRSNYGLSHDNENRRWILAARRQESPGLEQNNVHQEQGESKLFLYNLHSDVTNNDLKELFSVLGTVKEVTVHYDRLGRSTGSADLVYEKRSNALRAIREYNGVPLDGLQMKIELLRSAEELGIPRIGSQRQKAMARYRRER